MRTIQSKITLTFIAISLSVIVLLAFLSSYEIEQYFRDKLLNRLNTEIDVLEGILLETNEKQKSAQDINSTLQIISQRANLRITLINEDGRVVYESWVPDSLLATLENHGARPEVLQSLERGVGFDSRLSVSTNEQLFYVARSVNKSSMQRTAFPELKFIRVAISLSDVNQQIRDIRFNILLVAVVVLFVVLTASTLISRWFSKPIVEIAAIIGEIKAGNLDRKLPVRSQDEIGKLSELINEMTEKLQKDIEQLKRLERVRSEFLGNVSHELRTPIFSLKGFLETLLEGAVDDPQVNKEFLKKAYHHAGRLDTLLTDLIEISRIESGEMKMSFRYFDLAKFLTEVRDDYIDDAQKKRHTLSLKLPSSVPSVYGDKERLSQAIGNILDNAIKYSPEQSQISLSAVVLNGTVKVSISDNGKGIEAEHLPRIFERFYRVDKTRSREVGGTGLGLSITKHIIEAHGAKISVASEPGKGTTFSFELKA